MKREMKMMPNGNYEEIISPVQHECRVDGYKWVCKETGWELGRLRLQINDGDPYEGRYESEIDVKFCPFCGYQCKSALQTI